MAYYASPPPSHVYNAPPPTSLRQGRASSTPRLRSSQGYDDAPLPVPHHSARGYPSLPAPHAYSAPSHLATSTRRAERDPPGAYGRSPDDAPQSLRSQKSSPALGSWSNSRPDAVPLQTHRAKANPVLARMAAAGWAGVDVSTGEDGGQEDGARGVKYGSVDSGYGDSEHEEHQQDKISAWGLDKLKKAVWGGDDGEPAMRMSAVMVQMLVADCFIDMQVALEQPLRFLPRLRRPGLWRDPPCGTS